MADGAPDARPQPHTPIEAVAQAVLASDKYAALDPALVTTVAAQELGKGRRRKDAIKEVKTRLHQSVGAYWDGHADYAAWRAALDTAPDDVAQATVLQSIMRSHHSMRERLPFLDEFYSTLFAGLGPIQRVLDLGCGLNPLALPWMGLPADTAYYACDVDRTQIDFLTWWLAYSKQPGRAFVWNLLDGAPQINSLSAQAELDAEAQRGGGAQRQREAEGLSLEDSLRAPLRLRLSASEDATELIDVALLLKIVPCLAQLDNQIGARLLDEVTARVLIVSFPAQSLGGRRKGMVATYAAQMEALIAGRAWMVERFEFPSELAFRIYR